MKESKLVLIPVPSFDEFVAKIQSDVANKHNLYEIYKLYATMQRDPTTHPMSEFTARLACQAMVVMFDYAESLKEKGVK